jgi:tRNA (adenine37-N6)-methyltransferase
MQPIAYIRTPYRQKFAIPRQPNLVTAAIGDIHFIEPYADPNALRGLEGFSHVWLIFVFHETADKGWAATVAPPRLGGTERVGVFASRSPYRPNPLGLSVVEKVAVLQKGKELILRVRGIDLLDNTPILDIKPYLPYADALPTADGGYAVTAPGTALTNTESTIESTLNFSRNSLEFIENIKNNEFDLKTLITQVLLQDPRPAQHVRHASDREYGMLLYDYNIRWRVDGKVIKVLSIEQFSDPGATLPWQHNNSNQQGDQHGGQR